MNFNNDIHGTWPDGTKWHYSSGHSTQTNLDYHAVFGLHVQNTEILLTKNHRGWDLPGGHIEPGETAEQALLRELYEECGFTVEHSIPIGTLKLHLARGGGVITVLGYTIAGDTTLDPISATECTDAGYFDITSTTVRGSQKYELLQFLLSTLNQLDEGV